MNEQVLLWKKYMEQHYGCKVALRSPGHITLIPPFSMKEDKEEELNARLRKFCSQEKSFEVKVKNFDNFKPRVIFAHVEASKELLALKERLELYLLSLNKFPVKKEDRPFHPHITIANRDIQKKDFAKAWSYFSELTYEARFRAEGVSLLKHTNKEWVIASRYLLG